MATYAKILKDNADNQILPYTRAKLVYMDDNTTVQEAVTRPATNAQMGRVLIGNNLEYDGNGTISLSKSGVCNALGYIPSTNESVTQYCDLSNFPNGKSYIGDLAKINLNKDLSFYSTFNLVLTRINKKIYYLFYYGSFTNDYIANSYGVSGNNMLFTITPNPSDYNSSTSEVNIRSRSLVFDANKANGQTYYPATLQAIWGVGGHQITYYLCPHNTLIANQTYMTNTYFYDATQ